MKKNFRVFIYTVLTCYLPGVFAQDNQASIGVFSEALNQVVTPSKMSQSRQEVSASLSVLDRAFIQRSGVRTVEELMQFVPGFFVAPFRDSGQIFFSQGQRINNLLSHKVMYILYIYINVFFIYYHF